MVEEIMCWFVVLTAISGTKCFIVQIFCLFITRSTEQMTQDQIKYPTRYYGVASSSFDSLGSSPETHITHAGGSSEALIMCTLKLKKAHTGTGRTAQCWRQNRELLVTRWLWTSASKSRWRRPSNGRHGGAQACWADGAQPPIFSS